MNVSNILNKVCVYLNRQSEAQLVVSENSNSISQNATLNSLLFCLNYVVKRIATEFSYCKTTQNVTFSNNGTFDVATLTNNYFATLYLKNGNENVSFSEEGNLLKAKNGNYTLCYCYLPEDLSFSSNINCFSSCIYEDVIVLGVLSHYFLINGFYSEHDVYEKKFLDRINLATTKKSEKIVKGKVWL